MTKTAKQIFLESEGNQWYSRNKNALNTRGLNDRIISAIGELPQLEKGTCVLEIGSGGGERLEMLQKLYGFRCFGLEPSDEAVANSMKIGVQAIQGTADLLPFPDDSFEIVIFGFCLYLCDRQDLFKIAAEADRVLKTSGWLIIFDFYSEQPFHRPYIHKSDLFSHKMDYRSLFLWHPYYTCLKQDVRHHVNEEFTDNSQEWVALSVLRKSKENYGI